MRSVTVIGLLALLLQAQGEIQMGPLHRTDVDNTTLGVIGIPVLQGLSSAIRAPQPRLVPHGIPAPQKFSQAAPASLQFGRLMKTRAEAEIEAAPTPAPAPTGPTNVFGEKLVDCGPGLACPYKENEPQVCVDEVTRDFAPGDTTKFGQLPKSGNLEAVFKWKRVEDSDNYKWTNENNGKCFSVWEVGAESGFFGQAGLQWGTKQQWWGMQTGFVPTDYLVKCDALPSEVLTSKYSLDTYRSCYLETREYRYISPSSKNYNPKDNSIKTIKDQFKIDKPSLKEAQPDKLSAKCARFRAAIENICTLCVQQTAKKPARDALDTMCSSIEGTQMPSELTAETSSNAISITATLLISFFAGSAVILAMLRVCRDAPAAAEEPLLVTFS